VSGALFSFARGHVGDRGDLGAHLRGVPSRPSSVHNQMYDFLDGLLRHKSDMVNIEAARAICDMRGVNLSQLFRPVAGELTQL
jgi:hypothetical protein